MTVIAFVPVILLLILIVGSGALGIVFLILFNLATAGGVFYGTQTTFVPAAALEQSDG